MPGFGLNLWIASLEELVRSSQRETLFRTYVPEYLRLFTWRGPLGWANHNQTSSAELWTAGPLSEHHGL